MNESIEILKLLLYFFLYSIIGWILESVYKSILEKRVINSGFLHGPYCPIYGFGALILYYCFYDAKPTIKNIPSIFIIASLLLGSFELLCGLGFKYILGIEMWNYSGKFLNILNYTTVPILIGWGILGTIYVFFLHPLIQKFVSLFPKKIMNKLAIIIICIFLCDWLISTKRINLDPQILTDLVNPQNVT